MFVHTSSTFFDIEFRKFAIRNTAESSETLKAHCLHKGGEDPTLVSSLLSSKVSSCILSYL